MAYAWKSFSAKQEAVPWMYSQIQMQQRILFFVTRRGPDDREARLEEDCLQIGGRVTAKLGSNVHARRLAAGAKTGPFGGVLQ